MPGGEPLDVPVLSGGASSAGGTSGWLAAVLIGTAVLLLLPRVPRRRLHRVVGPASSRRRWTRVQGPAAGPGHRWASRPSGRFPGVGVRAGSRRRPDAATADPAELAEQVAALSRAGLPVVRIWQVLAASPGAAQALCAAVATTVAAGGRAPEVLSAVDGPVGLHWLGVAVDVAERAGAPLAEVLERFAAQLRAEAASAADRDAALAGPRATAGLLSWLPLGGVGLGLLVGADPVTTLLGTGPGRICLVIGAAFWWCGRRWTGVLVQRAERAGA